MIGKEFLQRKGIQVEVKQEIAWHCRRIGNGNHFFGLRVALSLDDNIPFPPSHECGTPGSA
jgi:hypothetical protein